MPFLLQWFWDFDQIRIFVIYSWKSAMLFALIILEHLTSFGTVRIWFAGMFGAATTEQWSETLSDSIQREGYTLWRKSQDR